MNYESYFRKKVDRNIRIYTWVFVLLYVLAFFLAIVKHWSEGTYSTGDVIKITLAYFGILTVMVVVAKLLAKLAFRSEGGLGAACAIAGVIGFWHVILLIIPAIRYHKGEAPEDAKEERGDRRVYRATVKAYQKAWRRQNFFARAVLPLGVLAATAAVIGGLYYLSVAFPTAFAWIMGIGFVILMFLVLAAMGGIQDVRITTTEYDVSVGEGWFDYGEVYVTERGSKTKDSTEVSFLGLVISFFVTPIVILVALALFFTWLFINLFKIVFPGNSRHVIYLHKKTAISAPYIPGPDFLKGIVFLINKFLYKVLRINLVNRDFWDDGIGPRYIESYLSERNTAYLEKLLDKVEEKYGYRYYW